MAQLGQQLHRKIQFCHLLPPFARALRVVLQFLEQSVPVIDVLRVGSLQPPQEHLCRLHVMAVLLQRGNHLALKGDILRQTLSWALDWLQPALESVTLHAEVIPRRWRGP